MEFNKLKGFWKTKSEKKENKLDHFRTKSDFLNSFTETNMLLSESIHRSTDKKTRGNIINSKKETLEPLEEIQPEVTSEGFGLKTPYGTHLDLDFVKYCDDISTDHKLKRSCSLRKPRPVVTSSVDSREVRLASSQRRLASVSSNERLNSSNVDDGITRRKPTNNNVDSLIETRRRLEAFRSFRTKGNRPPVADRSPKPTTNISKSDTTAGNKNGGNVQCNSSNETASDSKNFKITSEQLYVVRSQMANALSRIRELEEKLTEMITLEEKLATTEEEKQQLSRELEHTKVLLTSKNYKIQDKGDFPETHSDEPLTSLPNASDPYRCQATEASKPMTANDLHKRSHFKELRPLPSIPFESPPPTPKRKYCSVAVGEFTLIDESSCSCGTEKTFADVGSNCDLVPKQPYKADFSCSVKGSDIDTELGVPPLPPKKLFHLPPLPPNIRNSREVSSQTDLESLSDSNKKTDLQDAGVGDGVIPEMVDTSSSTLLQSFADVAVMTVGPVTHDRFTSSRDLVNFGRRDVSTLTTETISAPTAPTCDSLNLQRHAFTQVENAVAHCDVETSTDVKLTRNMGVVCLLSDDRSRKSFSDKVTMTLISGEKPDLSSRNPSVSVGGHSAMLPNHSYSANPEIKSQNELEIDALQEENTTEKFSLHSNVAKTKQSANRASPDDKNEHKEIIQNGDVVSNNQTDKEPRTEFLTSTVPIVSNNISETATTPNFKDLRKFETDSSKDSDLLPSTHEKKPSSTPIELKSIMKKPGTPTGAKKFLRFANGITSDDSDQSTTDEDGPSSGLSDEEVATEIVKIFLKGKKQNDEVIKTDQSETFDDVSTFFDSNKTNQVEESRSHSDINCEQTDLSSPDDKSATVDTDTIEVEMSVKSLKDLKVRSSPESYPLENEVANACQVLKEQQATGITESNDTVVLAFAIVQKSWFKTSAQRDSTVQEVDNFLLNISRISSSVCQRVVNMADYNGNTVLHYAISHGNLGVIERLLLYDYTDINAANLAGYTPTMLASLCEVEVQSDYRIFEKLFTKSKVNEHAKEAGQTALMLAASHGRTKMVELLLRSGAEINAIDFDGSTALMCAVEHGKLDVVKVLVGNPNCNTSIVDAEGCTALKIALDAKHKEIAVLLYAQMNFFPATKPLKNRNDSRM